MKKGKGTEPTVDLKGLEIEILDPPNSPCKPPVSVNSENHERDCGVNDNSPSQPQALAIT